MLSIIIPVYNTGDKLARCLDSILAQVFTCWELILVDDGSTDSSPVLCDQYARKDSRVSVFHTGNSGVSSARNRGIAESKGDWICFVDSDDWVEENYINEFCSRIPDGSDLIMQGYIKERDDIEIGRRHIAEGVIPRSSIPAYFLENDLIDFGSPCCKLFKRSIISDNGLAFPVNYSYGEDTVFFFRYINYCESISCVGKEGYHYVENSADSLSRRVHHSKPLLLFIKDSVPALERWAVGPAGEIILERQNAKNTALANRAINNSYILGYGENDKKDVLALFKQEIRPILKRKGLSLHSGVFVALTGLPVKAQLLLLNLFKATGIIKTS